MGNLYETITNLCKEKGISRYRMCKDIGIQPSMMTDLKSGRKKGLSAETAQKIANYFQVSVGYLLDSEKERTLVQADERIPYENYREVLAGSGVRILLDADSKLTQEQLDDIVDFIEFQQRKNGR